MLADRRRAHGLDLTATGAALERQSPDGVLLTERGDPSTIAKLCGGDGVPVLRPEQSERREAQHFTDCPIYEAERARHGGEPLGGSPSDVDGEPFATAEVSGFDGGAW